MYQGLHQESEKTARKMGRIFANLLSVKGHVSILYKNFYNSLIKGHNQNKKWTKNLNRGCSHCGTAEMNLTGNHEVAGPIPGLTQWVKDLVLPRAVV